MTSDEHGRSIIETTFEYDGRRYEAIGYGRIESGPGVDGRLVIEDVELSDAPPAGLVWIVWERAHEALAAQYWQEVEAEKERE